MGFLNSRSPIREFQRPRIVLKILEDTPMEGSVDIRPGRPSINAIRQVTDRKSIERVVAALGAILVTNLLKYLLSLNLVSSWFFYFFGLPPSTYFYNNLRYIVIVILLV